MTALGSQATRGTVTRAQTLMQEIIARNMETAERYGAGSGHDIPDQAQQIAAPGAGANDVEWEPEFDADRPAGHTHPEIDDALGRAAHKDEIRELRRELGALRASLATEPAPAYDWRSDLIGRLTSRKFALTVAGVIILLIATANGSLTADQALDKLPWIVGLFIAGESAVDAATALKGHAPAAPPRETPHAD